MPLPVLVGIAARGIGVSPRHYARTRTRAEFMVDLRAWSGAALFPIRMALSAFAGPPDPHAPRAPSSPQRPTGPAPYSHIRRVPGRKYITHDLGPIEGEAADPRRLDRDAYLATVAALRSEFAAESKAKGGGSGIASGPLGQVPAAWRRAG